MAIMTCIRYASLYLHRKMTPSFLTYGK